MSLNPPSLPAVDPDLLALLPPVLRATVQALGVSRACAWLSDHGGRNVHLPFFEGAGLDSDEVTRMRFALRNHMDGSGRITFPKADKLLHIFRDEAIRREHGQASLSILAHRYGLTTRQIQNICRANTQNIFREDALRDAPQARLF
jgi:hypothetical protein